MILGVLGVVYGDIGTSPLYALKASVLHFAADGVERWEVLGLLSLIFWALILTVTVKYVVFVLRADNRGEGGILALMALAQRCCRTERGRWWVALLGMAGACLFFGDGIITPAISVLSAVEGLKVVSSGFEEAVVPLSIVILIGLFIFQYRGTGSMGAIFGPICALWFVTIGAARAGRGGAGAGGAGGALADLCHRLLPDLQAGRLHRHGQRGAGGDRRRGALCRHGPFRQAADPASPGCASCCRRWR